MKLRSMLNSEEQRNVVAGSTTHKQGPSQWQLTCSYCGGMYYVDNLTFSQAISAMEAGFENPFCCDDCQADLEDVAH